MLQKQLSLNHKRVLRLGLNFAIAPRKIPVPQILTSVENSLWKVPQSERNIIRGKVTSIILNHRPPPPALTSDEWAGVTELKENKDIVIVRAHKGNATVIKDRVSYDDKVTDMLQDAETYFQLRTNPLAKTQKNVNAFISNLQKENKVSTGDAFKVKSSDPIFPRLYGLPKVHKDAIPLRPIASFIGSATSNRSREIARIIKHLVGKSVHHIRNAEDFLNEIRNLSINQDEIMASLDVVSLFTKVPVELALDVVLHRLELWADISSHTKRSIRDICQGLKICLNATHLHFRGNNYQQIFGTEMGSPVSAVIANMVMEDVDTRAWTPLYLARNFGNDTSMTPLFFSNKISLPISVIISMQLNSINFTMEKEKNGSIAFLDTLITLLKHGQLSTKVYRKPTHIGKYLHLHSEHPLAHKCALRNTLLYRADKLCDQESERKKEIDLVRSTPKQNGYPDRLLRRKKSSNATKNEEHETRGLAILPFLPGLTDKIKRCLTTHKIQVASKPVRKLGNLLTSIKDPVDTKSRQAVVHSIPCRDRNKRYIGETKRSLETRQKEHKADIKNKRFDKSAFTLHTFDLNHRIDWDNSKVLEFESNYNTRRFIESFHIISDKDTMNEKRSDLFPDIYRFMLQ